jgi:hypothetical protein
VEVGGGSGAIGQLEFDAVVGMVTKEFEDFAGIHDSTAVRVFGSASQLVDAAEKVFEAFAGERIVDVETPLFTLDPAGITHEGEVLRHRREITADHGVKLAHTARATAQDLRELKAGRVSEGLDHGHP